MNIKCNKPLLSVTSVWHWGHSGEQKRPSFLVKLGFRYSGNK
jgi:hypothetical protein